MIATTFDYVSPRTLDEVIAELGAPGARVLAGGTDLLTRLKQGLPDTTRLVDLRGVPDLAGVTRRAEGGLRVGAMTTLTALLDGPLLGAPTRALADAAATVRDAHVRNSGTVGGALGSPAGDLAAALMALSATANIRGPAGDRAAPVDAIVADGLRPAEVIVSLDLPNNASLSSAYARQADPASGLAICGAAVAIRVTAGRVRGGRVVLTAGTPRAWRVPAVEAALEGATLDAAPGAARHLRDAGIRFVDDLAASAEYRAHLAEVMIERALLVAIGTANAA